MFLSALSSTLRILLGKVYVRFRGAQSCVRIGPKPFRENRKRISLSLSLSVSSQTNKRIASQLHVSKAVPLSLPSSSSLSLSPLLRSDEGHNYEALFWGAKYLSFRNAVARDTSRANDAAETRLYASFVSSV